MGNVRNEAFEKQMPNHCPAAVRALVVDNKDEQFSARIRSNSYLNADMAHTVAFRTEASLRKSEQVVPLTAPYQAISQAIQASVLAGQNGKEERVLGGSFGVFRRRT